MSNSGALKRVSQRDAFAKIVRLLTNSGVDVQFRGFQPRVETQGDKVIRMVLPEIHDDASDALLRAMHGYVDHECGHIFYTPFGKAAKFSRGNGSKQALCNIVEDIRLEKLLPRDLPGTKENLARMYAEWIPAMVAPAVSKSLNDPRATPSTNFAAVMVPAMRAMAGQKVFQTYMDDNSLWTHFMPLINLMPNLSRRLREMETFADVMSIVEDVLAAIKSTGVKPPEPAPEPAPEPGPDKQPGEDAEPEQDDTGGEGHGEGSGTDDEEGEEDDNKCSGDDDDAGDEEGDDEGPGGSSKDDAGDDDGSDSGDEGEGSDEGDAGDESGDSEGDDADGDDGEGESNKPGKSDDSDNGDPDSKGDSGKNGRGKDKVSITDALKQLEPTQRRALFMYKKRKLSVSEIASELGHTEEQIKHLIGSARKRIKEILNGG